MKKRILPLALALLFLLSACGENNSTVTETPTPTPVAIPTPTPAEAVETAPSAWQEQYETGLRCWDEGDVAAAERAFEAAIDIDPKQAKAYLSLAEIYVIRGDEEKAVALLSEALDRVDKVSLVEQKLAALAAGKPLPPALTSEQPSAKDVVEVWWSTRGDVPDVVKTDISLPMVKEDLPGAAEVNELIAADYGYELERKTEEYDDTYPWNGGFAYPMYQLRYEVYPFGDLYEICIIGEQYSLYGSGPYWWINRYYYDAAEGRAAAEEEFLEAVGYTEEDLVAAFVEDMVMEEDVTPYTYDDVSYHYYIDAEKRPHFWVSLYA